MLWDGQSSGTIVNVARLVARGKPTVIYASPTKTFATLKTPEDLIDFLSAADPVVRAKLDESMHEHVAGSRSLRSSELRLLAMLRIRSRYSPSMEELARLIEAELRTSPRPYLVATLLHV